MRCGNLNIIQENITSFELDKKYKINIDILRVELQTCISHINTEATKNV